MLSTSRIDTFFFLLVALVPPLFIPSHCLSLFFEHSKAVFFFCYLFRKRVNSDLKLVNLYKVIKNLAHTKKMFPVARVKLLTPKNGRSRVKGENASIFCTLLLKSTFFHYSFPVLAKQYKRNERK